MARLISGSGTLTGLVHTAATTLPTEGISDGNHFVSDGNVADDDFLRVVGTEIEGRSASQTLSDIGGIGASNPTVTLGTNATFPAGHILQVVVATRNTEDSHYFDYYNVANSFDGSITPKYSDSKIWVQCVANWAIYGGSIANKLAYFGLYEVSATGTIHVDTRVGSSRSTSTGGDQYGTVVLNYLADAGTAGSAQTFGIASKNNGAPFDNGIRMGEGSKETVITLMEIKV